MSFKLNNSGLSCYALIFEGKHIGSVFASDAESERPWTALIHDACVVKMPALPHPFAMKQHQFRTFHELKRWLGIAPADSSARAPVDAA